MKKYLTIFLCVFLAFLPCLSLGAIDFGVILDQSPAFGGYGDDAGFDYTGFLIPRFSAFFGDRGELYISAGFRVEYEDKDWIFLPELLRTDFFWRFDSGELRAGRMQYSDPLEFVAEGLFDGARFSLDTNAGTFSFGAWYTGLLYNRRINITMTEDELIKNTKKTTTSDVALPTTVTDIQGWRDQQVYNAIANYIDPPKSRNNFDDYFAPRRIAAALDWEHPALAEHVRMKVGLLGQFDVSGSDLHSQYLTAKASVPVKAFVFDLGGCFELIEDSGDLWIGLAGEAGASWMLPTPIEDQLALVGRFSSGVVSGSSIEAFQPLTTSYQGEVLKAKLSGLSMLSLDYIARIHRTFSAGLSSSYFIRSDLGTFIEYGTSGYFLGNEFFGRLLWSPVSDIQLNLGGGAFLPAMGNAAPSAKPLWRIELNVILSLY